MPSRAYRPAATIAVCLVLFAVLISTAWVCDEAYLTFRTVDNWLHGYGLRWNPLERVQAFSHPLWLLLVAAGYALTGEPYYSVLALSIALTLAAAAIVVWRVARDAPAAIGPAVVLLLSKAFIDFSTSGLEHPLVYLLIAWFFAVYFGGNHRARISTLAWLTGLLAVTRAEAVVLVAPAFASVLAQDRRATLRAALTAALPPLGWAACATIYYGFPLPNAAYAWASAAPPLLPRAAGGALYILDSINRDPITVASLVVTTALAAAGALQDARPIVIGIVVSVLLILVQGGDAMSGRLLAAPLFSAAIALSRADLSGVPVSIRAHALVLLVLLGVMAPRSALLSSASTVPVENERTGIVDARLLTAPQTGLLEIVRTGDPPNARAAGGGHAARDAHRAVVPSGGNLVPASFFAGPTVHIIDLEGDADPLLARVPPLDVPLAGVTLRDLPDGYEDTVTSGVNRIAAPTLAAFYDRLSLVTRGPLWSAARWREIVRLNLTGDARPATPAR